MGLGVNLTIALVNNWDRPYSNDVKFIERAKESCATHDSVPENYDFNSNVKCENGVSMNVEDW